MASDFWKTQTYWSLPVYTGDVSGVCSALYELGGMVVMHDPSGCNSTYNTHDEIRWMSMESLIFLSGLTQLDAITGNDQKLVEDIASAAGEFGPGFIAIANSPVPWLIATDFGAVCRKVQELTFISTFHVETNAMHDYTSGAGKAFLALAKMLFGEETGRNSAEYHRFEADGHDCADEKIRVNILGLTPLDFTIRSDIGMLRGLLEAEGFEVVSCWAMGETLEKMKDALSADVNLVVSSTGIDTARWMEENFRIPYTAGVPVGSFSSVLYSRLRSCAREKTSCAAYLEVPGTGEGGPASGIRCRRCTAGEPVLMGSVAADLVLSGQEPCDLIPLTETTRGLVPDSVSCPAGEQQIRDVLGRYEEVTADPMLAAACKSGCTFHEMPHFALSGRLYLDRIRPLFGKGS